MGAHQFSAQAQTKGAQPRQQGRIGPQEGGLPGAIGEFIDAHQVHRLVQGGEIDLAISPQLATIGTLLTHVRRGDIESVHSLRRGAAEAIEAIAHGDAKSSKVVGRMIEEIALPPGTTIGAVIRDEEVLIAHDDTVIESGDHVILFLVDKKYIRDVERLFQVGLTFF